MEIPQRENGTPFVPVTLISQDKKLTFDAICYKGNQKLKIQKDDIASFISFLKSHRKTLIKVAFYSEEINTEDFDAKYAKLTKKHLFLFPNETVGIAL